MGSVSCIMGGWLWFLGHACSSYVCTGSALDAMDYGLAEAIWVNNEPTARTLLTLRGSNYEDFFTEIQSNCIHMHLIIFIVYISVFTPSRVLTTLFRNYR